MKTKNKKNDANTDILVLEVIKAGLSNDVKRLELATTTLSRILQEENKDLSKKIREVLGAYSMGGSFRGHDMRPIPTDHDSHLEIATIKEPGIKDSPMPTLSENLRTHIDFLIEEREKSNILIRNGIQPTTRLLLIGDPGTGKTMLAHHLAAKLKKKLVILDLSSTISSLLGKTGSNIKKALKYAQETSSVLLLDEFDAIAKKRDDSTDLGEIKRVVNVLLMELDNWPASSFVIATSNHPEILDKAIWRRFDHVIEIEKPEYSERLSILKNELNNFIKKQGQNAEEVENSLLKPIAQMLDGMSASDICRYANNIKRRTILKKGDFDGICIAELEYLLGDKNVRGNFCRLAKEVLGPRITLRELSKITGLTKSGVNHHLNHG